MILGIVWVAVAFTAPLYYVPFADSPLIDVMIEGERYSVKLDTGAPDDVEAKSITTAEGDG